MVKGEHQSGQLSKKILLVNDEIDINITVRQVLEDKGFKVDSYENPRLALENFRPSYYDLVIVDSKMPQMNGFTFYKGVKALDRKVKTCFLTAEQPQPEQHLDDAHSSLPDSCFIRIPIENERLLDSIEKIMAET